MKALFPFLITLAVAIAGVNVSYAGAVKHAGSPKHFTYSEWAYFSDGGFMSHRESYAAQDNEAAKVTATVSAPGTESTQTGHQYTLPEYLYFSGRGFSSD